MQITLKLANDQWLHLLKGKKMCPMEEKAKKVKVLQIKEIV